MQKSKKIELCPVCGNEPMIDKQWLISTNREAYFATCANADNDGSHEVGAKPGKTKEQALNFWNATVKKWRKLRENVISEREAVTVPCKGKNSLIRQ